MPLADALKYILPALGVGAAMAPEDAEAMAFIGPKGLANIFGKETAQKMLLKAEQMFSSGATNEEARRATGIFKGMDGKPRFEMPEDLSKARIPESQTYNVPSRASISEVFSEAAPWLEKAYPKLSRGNLRFGKTSSNDASGVFDRAANEIVLSITRDDSRMAKANAETALHELQHGIQFEEGFAGGGSSGVGAWLSPSQRPLLLETARSIFNDWKPASMESYWGKPGADGYPQHALDMYAKYLEQFGTEEAKKNRWNSAQLGAPAEIYKRLAGEVEARDVVKRSGFTPEQRADISPDLPDNAIVRFPKAIYPGVVGVGAAMAPFDADAAVQRGYPSFVQGYKSTPAHAMESALEAGGLEEAWNPVEALAGGLGGGLRGALTNLVQELGLEGALKYFQGR